MAYGRSKVLLLLRLQKFLGMLDVFELRAYLLGLIDYVNHSCLVPAVHLTLDAHAEVGAFCHSPLNVFLLLGLLLPWSRL